MTPAGTAATLGLTLTVPPRRTDAVPALAHLPVAIIGAGPVGLAAAAELAERGIDFVLYEAGPAAGSALTLWGHTRLFSPWRYLTSAASVRRLEPVGWAAPHPDVLPTGHELLRDYVLPLAATLGDRVHYGARVTAVSRQGMDRTRSANRAATPFLLRIQTDAGSHDALARAVIDTSGTYSTPNPLAASGLEPMPAVAGAVAQSAAEVSEHLVHALPDVLGSERARFAGRHTVVVGAGHSAANTLLNLAELAAVEPGTTVSWLIRTATPVRVYGDDSDELAARASLGSRVHALVTNGQVALIDGFEIDTVAPSTNGGGAAPGAADPGAADRVALIGRRHGAPARLEADLIVGATGFRPDLDMLREIRLALDEIVEAPRLLAPLIDPNLHSCGTVPAHGVDVLTHPEPNFYLAGMKSFGRAPTFLLATGYEQVRSIADELAGNRAAARLVTLVLPETGVCCTTPPEAPGAAPTDAAPAASAACCS
ncbi:FAD-dependent oxidoreductase [Cryobacterium frigoriphilum]|uniref:FAD-dependent oxidoreductase n=1 Tax=Cryobacterium frigoriphilum TaxID=1259150 RepID=A0A4R9A9I0_9MICO|nr:FAD-dependent oxidoreductase [Cryobacterium frigoriphilum]TFD54581.1 FAD-dependent oxidoreductase [Cryobacterium frigoriphilum]